MPHYRLVYSVADAGYQAWAFVGVGTLILAVMIGFLIHDTRQQASGFRVAVRRVYLLGMIVFAVSLLLIGGGATRDEYVRNRRALESGAYEVVTGTVEHFVPAPEEGHKDESFDVAGHHYSYSDYVVTPSFHQSRSHGGPIREGLAVRIADHDGQILRLEVAVP